MKKAYKALMLDLDGTTIPNKREGMPSQKVKKAIKKAHHKLHIGIATSRPHFIVDHIVKDLELSGPSIVSGGARVMDFETGHIYYDQPMDRHDVKQVFQIIHKYKLPLYVDTEKGDITISTVNHIPKNSLGGFVPQLNRPLAEKIKKEIEYLDVAIAVHLIPAWKTGAWTITLSHMAATKQHGIFEVAKILGIDTHDIIGVGDGANDLPLLLACGLKVAMGNADETLKDIADYIAPTVDEDGVAHVIEKFVLKTIT